MEKIPTHIAIIPDGNRRWAVKHKLMPYKGHIEGAKRIEEIINGISELGVKHITIWGSSYDNLVKRPKLELATLNTLYWEMCEKIIKNKNIQKNGVRVRIIGEYHNLLVKNTVKQIIKAEKATINNKSINITFLIGYNGDREMLSAINNAVNGNLPIESEAINNNLWTKDLPDVDLIIRTGGEKHLSAGFMMWKTQYSKLYFSDKMWPDFGLLDLKEAIMEYSNSSRRFGR